MLIIEGCDGSGKTTLIEQLGYRREHVLALRDWIGNDEAPIAYARKILAAGEKTAFDRFYLSEMIYGPILRGASGITPQEAIVLRRLLRARGIATIVCLPPYVTALKNVMQGGRERPAYQTSAFLWHAYNRWADLLARDLTGLIRFNYLEHPYPLPSWQPTCPPGVIGSPTARFLIIGEQVGLPLDLPFFSMEGSNGYLNQSLWDAGFAEDDLAFVDALDGAGRRRDLEACLLTSTQYIIALGADATECSRRQLTMMLPLFTIPHPQYWMRFHAHQRGDYVQQLRAIRGAITR